jgi:hypothetical protein
MKTPDVYCDLILTLAARYKLPAVYWEPLKGHKPADLPVQTPTK